MLFRIFALCLASVNAAAFYPLRDVNTWDTTLPVMMFDLDNTLYAASAYNLNHRRMAAQFLMDRRGMSLAAAERLLNVYRQRYDGVVARGIAEDLGMDAMDFERYVNFRSNIPNVMRADPRLRAMLSNMKARLYVFTNASLEHALMTLNALGIRDRFHGVIYIDYGRSLFTTKPHELVYREAMRFARAKSPSSIYYLDDELSYARGGHALGWNAYLLDTLSRSRFQQDLNFPRIASIYDLPRALPMLF